MNQKLHSDEYNSLDAALAALEEYMVNLSRQHVELARRIVKLEEAI